MEPLLRSTSSRSVSRRAAKQAAGMLWSTLAVALLLAFLYLGYRVVSPNDDAPAFLEASESSSLTDATDVFTESMLDHSKQLLLYHQAADCSNFTRRSTPEPTVAICLIGSARYAEYTGRSISKWLLRSKASHKDTDLLGDSELDMDSDALSHADVFLITPFDRHTHKITEVRSSHFVFVHIYNHFFMDESIYPKRMKDNFNESFQDTLHHFYMEEQCIHAIRERETYQGFSYRWIVKSRLDSHWSQFPTLLDFHPNKLFIPRRAELSGLNDKFSIANERNSFFSFLRFKHLWDFRFSKLESPEEIFLDLISRSRIQLVRSKLPFCTLSRSSSKVYPVFHTEPLSGYNCWPCIPNSKLKNRRGKMCDPQSIDQETSDAIFDDHLPMDEVNSRKYLASRTWAECVRDFKQVKEDVLSGGICLAPGFPKLKPSWVSPSPEAICTRRWLGDRRLEGMDKFKNGWPVVLDILNSSSVIYFMTSFSLNKWIKDIETATSSTILSLEAPVISQADSPEIRSVEEKANRNWKWKSIIAVKIDLLLLNIGTFTEKVILHWLTRGSTEPICQLSINFSYLKSPRAWKIMLQKLESLGFHLDSCFTFGNLMVGRCNFFSTQHCNF